MLMANAHWQLSQSDDPNTQFKDVYRYGTSKSNSRIEGWWEELTSGQTKQWQTWFRILKARHSFDGSEKDLIAVAFIYLPIIRKQIYHFVHLWNIHKIRKQRNRPYLVHGKPVLNYYYPRIRNSEAIQCGRICDEHTLHRLRESVKGYGKFK